MNELLEYFTPQMGMKILRELGVDIEEQIALIKEEKEMLEKREAYNQIQEEMKKPRFVKQFEREHGVDLEDELAAILLQEIVEDKKRNREAYAAYERDLEKFATEGAKLLAEHIDKQIITDILAEVKKDNQNKFDFAMKTLDSNMKKDR